MDISTLSGKLIVIEGIDGAGKSTLADRVVALLQEDGCRVLLTREPGGSKGGVAIRSLIADGVAREVPEAEYLLFAADRSLHIRQTIIPALQKGTIVISDRMTDSSLVYQGYGRGVDLEMIEKINQWTMRGIKPDLTVYLAIDYSTAQQRLGLVKRTGALTAFDQERASFFKQVVRGYETLYAGRRDVLRLDGSLTVETNAQQVYQMICGLVGSESNGQ